MRWLGALLFTLTTAAFAQDVDEDIIRRIHEAHGKDRYQPFNELAQRGSAAIPTLAKLMQDPERVISWEAMQCLVHIKDSRVLPLLLTKADSSSGNKLSNNFLAIGNHGNPLAVPTILPFLKSKDKWERFGAAYALGQLGDPTAIPHLKRLEADPFDSARWQSKEAIRRIQSVTAKHPTRLTDPNAWWKGKSTS